MLKRKGGFALPYVCEFCPKRRLSSALLLTWILILNTVYAIHLFNMFTFNLCNDNIYIVRRNWCNTMTTFKFAKKDDIIQYADEIPGYE